MKWVCCGCCCCFCRLLLLLQIHILNCVILWHIMACDFGTSVTICCTLHCTHSAHVFNVHDNRFSTMSRSLWCFVFFDVRPNILQENRITLQYAISKMFVVFQADELMFRSLTLYWNIICAFFLCVYLQIEWYKWNIQWIETLKMFFFINISNLCLCVWLRACLGIFFPASLSLSLTCLLARSLARSLIFVQ